MIGRIVLFHHAADDCDWPAMIIKLYDDGTQRLKVFRAGDPTLEIRAAEGEGPSNWSWPQRVEETTP